MIESIKWDLPMVHIIYAMPAITLLTHPLRDIVVVNFCSWWCNHAKSFTAIRCSQIHRRRRDYRNIFIFSFMPFSWLKFRMHAFVREIKKEWFLSYSFIQPFDRIICEKICCVTPFGLFYSFSIDIKCRIIILTLSAEAQPVIKS